MITEEDIRTFFKEIGLVKGIFKEGDITYVLEINEYPHDERCEGTMCWCSNRAKKENLEKWEKYKKSQRKKCQ